MPEFGGSGILPPLLIRVIEICVTIFDEDRDDMFLEDFLSVFSFILFCVSLRFLERVSFCFLLSYNIFGITICTHRFEPQRMIKCLLLHEGLSMISISGLSID